MAPAVAAPLQVTILQSEHGGAYDEFTSALRTALPSSQVSLNILEAGQPIADKAADLYIAVGMKAASQLAGTNTSATLNVLIPRSGYKKLLADYPQLARHPQYSAIYMEQPVERQFALIAAAFPERRRVGLLYEGMLEEEAELLRRKAAEYSLKLYEHKLTDGEALFDGLQDVLQHSDILMALPSPSIYNGNTLRNILLTTYRAGVPLSGFSSAYVRAGAVIAVFSTPAQLAEQAAAAIQKYSDSSTLPPPQYPRQFDIAINERVAQSMNLRLPATEELLRKIDSRRRLP